MPENFFTKLIEYLALSNGRLFLPWADLALPEERVKLLDITNRHLLQLSTLTISLEHSGNHQTDGTAFDESLTILSLLIWKHFGSPVSLHFPPSTSLATPGAHVKMRAIPAKRLSPEI